MMMKRAVAENPDCDGIVLGAQRTFHMGETQRECYVNTLTLIDQLGQFIAKHGQRKGESQFGGNSIKARTNRKELAVEILRSARAHQRAATLDRELQRCRRRAAIREFIACERLVVSRYELPRSLYSYKDSAALCAMARWRRRRRTEETDRVVACRISRALSTLLSRARTAGSPALRDTSPSIVLIPGLGMFSFSKSKTEARIVGEFYTNAIHVMEVRACSGMKRFQERKRAWFRSAARVWTPQHSRSHKLRGHASERGVPH